MTKTELRKMNLKDLASFLGKASAAKSVKADKDLFARMKYTSKAIKSGEKVAKKDLLELASDCLTVMAAAETKPDTKPEEPKKAPEKESSLKKKPSKGAKEEPKVEPKPSKPSRNGKKSEETKPEPNKSEPKEKKAEPKKESKPKGFSFPSEFEDEDGIRYVLAEDLNSYDTVKEAFSKEENIVFATHWTEAMLKTGAYGNGQITKKSDMPKAFVEELDLLQPIYVAESLPNTVTVSMYTECEYWFAGSDFKKFVSNNLHFRVYRVVE